MATRKPTALNLSKPSVAKKVAAKRGVKAVPDSEVGVATKQGIMSKAEAKKATNNTPKADPVQRKIVRTSMGNLSVPVKTAKPKKPSTDVKFRGFVIPAGRKSGDSEEGVPTIELRKVSDVSKLFAVLPKGAYIDSFTSRRINVYNRAGMLIVELSTYSA